MHTPSRLVPPWAATAIALLLFAALASSSAAQPTAVNASAPSTRPTDEQLKSLISQLSADDFKQRNKAQRDLVALGDLAEPHLHDRLNQNPDPETRTLIEAALTSIARAREIGPTLVTLDLENAAPQDAFATLAKQAGLKIAPPVDHLLDALRDEPVTTKLGRATFWDALLTIAPQSGVAFTSIDAGGHITLEMLPTERAAAPPAAAAGPFLVTISRIDCRTRWLAFSGQRPFNAPLQIPIKPNPPCRLFLFAWAEPRLKPVRWFIDSIDECITDTGHDMRDAAPPEIGQGSSGPVNSATQTIYTLAAPDPKATRIARFAITARFVLVTKTQTLEVPDILAAKNATHWLGGFRLVINQVNKTVVGRYACNLSLHRDNRSQADWDQFRTLLDEYPCYLVDADGNPFIGSWGSEESRQNQITVQSTIIADPRRGVVVGEPAKMIWTFPQEIREVKVPLVFRDVPLP